jgi:hypothetical protein
VRMVEHVIGDEKYGCVILKVLCQFFVEEWGGCNVRCQCDCFGTLYSYISGRATSLPFRRIVEGVLRIRDVVVQNDIVSTTIEV